MYKIRDFTPLEGVHYKYEYLQMFRDIADNKIDEMNAIRYLVTNDLWFILYFVLEIPGCERPFVVNQCRVVEEGPQDYTLDIWSREHYKSSIITIAETIQYALKYPEHSNAIGSYVKSRSEDFLAAIKETFESKEILKKNFSEILYENPKRDASRWSIEKGIVFKRKTNRPEPTIGAYGLIEGMPTGVHFERWVYDDIITQDICENTDTMEKVKTRFDASKSLGKEGGRHRIVGTYYHYNDPLVYIRDKIAVGKVRKKQYTLRLIPATDNGEISGKPVLFSQEYWDSLKNLKTLYTQYLLDPSPREVKILKKEWLKLVKVGEIPERLFKFFLIDPSGKKGTGDPWAFLVVGVAPREDKKASNLYLLDAVIKKMRREEAIKVAADMYCNHGNILKICVESWGQTTTEVHLKEELSERGYDYVSEETGEIVLFKPSGRAKVERIGELACPLQNQRIFIVDTVTDEYRQMIYNEIDGYPHSNDDHAIDALSYFYTDLLPYYPFPKPRADVEIVEEIPMGAFF